RRPGAAAQPGGADRTARAPGDRRGPAPSRRQGDPAVRPDLPRPSATAPHPGAAAVRPGGVRPRVRRPVRAAGPRTLPGTHGGTAVGGRHGGRRLRRARHHPAARGGRRTHHRLLLGDVRLRAAGPPDGLLRPRPRRLRPHPRHLRRPGRDGPRTAGAHPGGAVRRDQGAEDRRGRLRRGPPRLRRALRHPRHRDGRARRRRPVPGPGSPRMSGGTGAGRDLVLVANSVDELGGVTSWTHRMARLFTERGHRVRVVGIAPAQVAQDVGATPYPVTTLYERRPPPAWRPRRLRDRFDAAARLRQARREAERRERAAALSALLRGAAPGGVVIVTQVWAMEWVALADTGGLHVVGMTHESFEESRRTSRFARVQRYFRDVDRLLALTREDADRWINQGLNNLDVMPNPLPWLPARPSPRTGRTVVSIG